MRRPAAPLSGLRIGGGRSTGLRCDPEQLSVVSRELTLQSTGLVMRLVTRPVLFFSLVDAEPPCRAACGPDASGELELAGAVYGLNFCFAGTAAPVAPFLECGVGNEADAGLGCETSNCE